jgi:nicotinamide riboside transporter PnuC
MEICRLVDAYIQNGLSSTSTFVIFGTLHGVLYLIQSANIDEFNGIFVIVFNFLLEEFQRLNSKIDILNARLVHIMWLHN